MAAFDFIGDVHGEASKLEGLLEKLSYAQDADGVYRHPTRTAFFVGDLIDRGKRQIDSVEIVKRMVEGGAAKIVMGNHEFNAIGYATMREDFSDTCRPRKGPWGPGNTDAHKDFLAAVGVDSDTHRTFIEWFNTMPLWYEDDDVCVVHACWQLEKIEELRALGYDGTLGEGSIREQAFTEGTPAFLAIERILKGPEVDISRFGAFPDKGGKTRTRARYAWWEPRNGSYAECVNLKPEEIAALGLPDNEFPPEFVGGAFGSLTKVVFFGHYWRKGEPVIDNQHALCVDYSAVNEGEHMVAYRFTPGELLADSNFVRFPG